MRGTPTSDDDLVRRLPLPLAQLYRRARNAKTAREQHLAAFYLWEAAVKLLGCAAFAEPAERDGQDSERYQWRHQPQGPLLQDWWDVVCRRVPLLAEHGDEAFRKLDEQVLGRAHPDWPRTGDLYRELERALRATQATHSQAPGDVRLADLIDRLIAYRKREIDSPTTAAGDEELYRGLGELLLAGAVEVFSRVDVLAGRRLVYLTGLRLRCAEGFALVGETPQALEPFDPAAAEGQEPLWPHYVYLQPPPRYGVARPLRLVYDLLRYDAETGEALFLHGQEHPPRRCHLCYTTGRVDLPDVSTADERPAPSAAEASAAHWRGGPQEAATRRQIGEFEALAELGVGGMGVVYRAWQPSLGRHVALKCMRSDRPGSEELLARFTREIRALGRVDHPNLVKIFTSGSDDGLLYFAMELVEGASLYDLTRQLRGQAAGPGGVDLPAWYQALAELCRRDEPPAHHTVGGPSRPERRRARPPSAEERAAPEPAGTYVAHVVELTRQAAEAAHALHEAGVIHRDIKPANLLVHPDGSRIVLIDLGLAKLDDDVDSPTGAEHFLGTPRYASPEQARSAKQVDVRADVYSLGATLWELLTFRSLFGEGPAIDLIQRSLEQEPEPPARLNPRVPADLEAVVLKCLEKDPARRYATAADLAAELGRWQRGEPVQARPPSPVRRLARFLRRHGRVVLTATLGAYALLTTGLLGALLLRPRQAGSALSFLAGCGLMLVAFGLGWAAVALVRSRRTTGPRPAAPAEAPAEATRPPAPRPAARPARRGLLDDEAFGPQTIVVHYPTPIALAYRRFCQQDQPRARLERLFKAFEAALKYLVFLGVCDLLHCLAKSGRADAALPGHQVFDFLRLPTKMSLGRWVEALRETARALARHRDRFVDRLPDLCRPGGRLDDVLGWIVSNRNLAEHGQGSLALTDQQCEQLIRQTHPKLIEMLQAVRLVREYPLGFMRLLNADEPHRPGLYSVHACKGAHVAASEHASTLQTAVKFGDQRPFVAAPGGAKLLYLWPLWLQRQAEHTQRPTLYGFEQILGSRGRFLTRLHCAAVDLMDEWEVSLRDDPATSHAWLLEELRALPACLEVPPDTRLEEYLVPVRGDDLIGRQLGPYRLQAIAGYGGFAVVYDAVHADDGRQVAVKVLDLPGAYRDLTGFEREFDRLKEAGAGHPGIIRCHERGREWIGKRLYAWYAMDFANGGDLADCLAQRRAAVPGALPWARPELRGRILREYRAALEAVAHLHGLDFVHRDVKPSNLLILDDGEVRLSDFGLVKNLNPSEQSLKRTGTSRRGPTGTWYYMPPEQQRGEEVGKTADVYALGMVLAELATGVCPEPKADPAGQSTLQDCTALDDLPDGLCRLIRRCTATVPEHRPADAGVLRQEFEKVIAGLPDGAGG
jgi:serine/threonine protein kinase